MEPDTASWLTSQVSSFEWEDSLASSGGVLSPNGCRLLEGRSCAPHLLVPSMAGASEHAWCHLAEVPGDTWAVQGDLGRKGLWHSPACLTLCSQPGVRSVTFINPFAHGSDSKALSASPTWLVPFSSQFLISHLESEELKL